MRKKWTKYTAMLLCATLIGGTMVPGSISYARTISALPEEGSDNRGDPRVSDREETPEADEYEVLEDNWLVPPDIDKYLLSDKGEASPSDAAKEEITRVTTMLSSDELDELRASGEYDIAPMLALDRIDDDWENYMSRATFGMSQEVDGFYGEQFRWDPGLAEIYNMLDEFCKQIENGTLESTDQVWRSTNSIAVGIVPNQLAEFEQAMYEELSADQWACMNAYFWDHPQYWGVSSEFTAETQRSTVDGLFLIKVTMEVKLSCEDPGEVKRQLDQINQIVDSVEIKGKNIYDKVKAIHDYICDTVSYDLDAEAAHSVYGALVNKKAVCDGFARTFKVFCDKQEIENAVIVGKGQKPDMTAICGMLCSWRTRNGTR